MESEGDFRLGFWFGLLVARSMGFNANYDAILDQVRDVARGELTLMPSPEEVKRDAEAHFGRSLTHEEEAALQAALPTNRAHQDARNRDYADLILRLMGRPM
jgi:hypothetical protein